MDGFKIRVFLDKNFPGEKCKSTDLTTSQQRAGNALRDLRSYKEVVMGKRRPVDRSRNSMTEVDTINKKFGRQSEEVSSVAVLEAKRDDIQEVQVELVHKPLDTELGRGSSSIPKKGTVAGLGEEEEFAGGNQTGNLTFSAANEASGGLISLWDSSYFKAESKIISERYILLIGAFLANNFRCGLLNIYAPNDIGERRDFLDSLSAVIASIQAPIFIGGDFNSVKAAEEHLGAAEPESMICQKQVHLAQRRFQRSVQCTLPKGLSDHNPIQLKVVGSKGGPRPFKYFPYWAEIP
ncbi:hypothetical protein V6N13_043444 [Hibiscus sabdariffa]